jgi:protein-arginine kinase activator protein McsA
MEHLLSGNPIAHCETCGKPIYEDWRKDKKQRKVPIRFCSRSCSNRHFRSEESKNRTRLSILNQKGTNGGEVYCQNCGKYLGSGKIAHKRQFCSVNCRSEYKDKIEDEVLDRWQQGENVNSEICVNSGVNIYELLGRYKNKIKKILFDEQNGKCTICGQSSVHNGQPLIFILDHINGHWQDQIKINLRLVCPNCNSQLATTKYNLGNGRQATRIAFLKKRKVSLML